MSNHYAPEKEIRGNGGPPLGEMRAKRNDRHHSGNDERRRNEDRHHRDDRRRGDDRSTYRHDDRNHHSRSPDDDRRSPDDRRYDDERRHRHDDDDRRRYDDRRHDRRPSDDRRHDDQRRRDDRPRDDRRRGDDRPGRDNRPRDDNGSRGDDRPGRDNRPRDDNGPRGDGGRNNKRRSRSRENTNAKKQVHPKHGKVDHQYRIVPDQKDDKLNANVADVDPRKDAQRRMTKQKAGRNTESFDPASTLVRPDLRIHVGSPSAATLPQKIKHDDVVIVPELFGKLDDWDLYYKLVEEMTELQQKEKNSEWISWHEGAHLISKNPASSPTFQTIIDRLCEYFSIRKQSIGTRFNWYKDSADWKPFHHDSAAFNPQRAKNQNITVGVSFGATRELAFIRAAPLADSSGTDDKVRLYFPQTNNGVFSFGRDANILWKVSRVSFFKEFHV